LHTVALPAESDQHQLVSDQFVSGQFPQPGDVARWGLARSTSPRARARVAHMHRHTGELLNSYRTAVPVKGPEPTLPVATGPTGRAGRYRLVAWDHHAHQGPLAEDLAQLRAWLTVVGIPHSVCASGPGGGRHIWTALVDDGADIGLAGQMARPLAARLPTLDITPSVNPARGAVRPPSRQAASLRRPVGARHNGGDGVVPG